MNLQTTNSEAFSPQQTHHFLYFTDFAENYVRQCKTGTVLTKNKTVFSHQTIRQYESALTHFKEFEMLLSQRINTAEVNKTILQAFEWFLISKELTKNSVSLYLSKVKAICNLCLENGLTYNQFRSVTTPKEQVTKIYLSESEITKLRNAELRNSETLVLDTFLLQCYTGLRYTFLQKFLKQPSAYIKEHEGRSYIDIVSDKNNEQSIIPVHREVQRILMKYNGNVPTISEQYVNRAIKKIADKAGITQPIPKRITKGGKMTEELIPKWKMVSSHTARSSFITNLKRYVNNEAVIVASGHRNESQMLTYVRTTKMEKAEPLFNCEFFN